MFALFVAQKLYSDTFYFCYKAGIRSAADSGNNGYTGEPEEDDIGALMQTNALHFYSLVFIAAASSR